MTWDTAGVNKLNGYPWARVLHSDIGDDWVLAFPDESTDGDPMWAAVSLKYDGAIGQGETSDEAIADCREVIGEMRDMGLIS